MAQFPLQPPFDSRVLALGFELTTSTTAGVTVSSPTFGFLLIRASTPPVSWKISDALRKAWSQAESLKNSWTLRRRVWPWALGFVRVTTNAAGGMATIAMVSMPSIKQRYVKKRLKLG